jgi:hypothetical protein
LTQWYEEKDKDKAADFVHILKYKLFRNLFGEILEKHETSAMDILVVSKV